MSAGRKEDGGIGLFDAERLRDKQAGRALVQT